VRWGEIYRLVDQWLTQGRDGPLATAESHRLADDLADSFRLRPALTFSGFKCLSV
jgi:hypothetical protein